MVQLIVAKVVEAAAALVAAAGSVWMGQPCSNTRPWLPRLLVVRIRRCSPSDRATSASTRTIIAHSRQFHWRSIVVAVVAELFLPVVRDRRTVVTTTTTTATYVVVTCWMMPRSAGSGGSEPSLSPAVVVVPCKHAPTKQPAVLALLCPRAVHRGRACVVGLFWLIRGDHPSTRRSERSLTASVAVGRERRRQSLILRHNIASTG